MPIFSDLLVTAIGALTSVLTALILSGIEHFFDFSLYTWSFWFIVPIGAILSGFAAAIVDIILAQNCLTVNQRR